MKSAKEEEKEQPVTTSFVAIREPLLEDDY